MIAFNGSTFIAFGSENNTVSFFRIFVESCAEIVEIRIESGVTDFVNAFAFRFEFFFLIASAILILTSNIFGNCISEFFEPFAC